MVEEGAVEAGLAEEGWQGEQAEDDGVALLPVAVDKVGGAVEAIVRQRGAALPSDPSGTTGVSRHIGRPAALRSRASCRQGRLSV